jgi:hypothetical protein
MRDEAGVKGFMYDNTHEPHMRHAYPQTREPSAD